MRNPDTLFVTLGDDSTSRLPSLQTFHHPSHLPSNKGFVLNPRREPLVFSRKLPDIHSTKKDNPFHMKTLNRKVPTGPDFALRKSSPILREVRPQYSLVHLPPSSPTLQERLGNYKYYTSGRRVNRKRPQGDCRDPEMTTSFRPSHWVRLEEPV